MSVVPAPVGPGSGAVDMLDRQELDTLLVEDGILDDDVDETAPVKIVPVDIAAMNVAPVEVVPPEIVVAVTLEISGHPETQ